AGAGRLARDLVQRPGQHVARGEIPEPWIAETRELGGEQDDGTVVADGRNGIELAWQHRIGDARELRGGVPQRPFDLADVDSGRAPPRPDQLRPEATHRVAGMRVGPVVDALPLLDVDAEHVAAQVEEERVELRGQTGPR